MIDENTQGGDDVDKLLEGIESPSAPRAEQQPESEPAQEAAQTEAPSWNGDEWGFEWNGKKIVPESRDKVRTWMSQGYNYSQRMGELNRERREWEQKLKAAEENSKRYERYREVDEYAQKNPDWWKHVESGYQSRETHGLDPNLRPVVEPLMQRLQQTESILQQWQAAQAQEESRKADQALEGEIESIRKQYPNIDMASTDESGKPLELRVLEHARQIGTTSFRAAFRDYLHDKLLDVAKADGREAIAKGQAQAAKKGIIGTTPTPVKGLKPAQNVRGKSYDSLVQEALTEFGINH